MRHHSIRRPVVGRVYLWLIALASGIVAIEYVGQRIDVRRYADDFEPSFWEPWHAIRSGLNPYPDPATPFADGNPFLYPPLAAELTLPLSWFPFAIAAIVFAAGLAVAAALTLWALDVRQPALWAIWMLSAAVVGPLAAGNATMLVILAVALTWRWRDRPGWAAAALTAGLVIKLFVWPVVLWLLVTRRYRAAALTMGATAFLTIASWAAIGFRGLTDYPALLDNASDYLGGRGLLAYALVEKSASPSAALATGLAVAAVLVVGAFMRRDDDRAAITLVLLAALYATPIVWLHYFGLLIVPAALYGGWLWATIPLLAVSRLTIAGAPKPTWMITFFIVVTALVAARALVVHPLRSRLQSPAREASEGVS